LWKGIGAFISQHPKYRSLFGPVSIPNTYSPLSRALIREFMSRSEHRHELTALIQSRTPYKISKSLKRRLPPLAGPIRAFDDLSDLVSHIEPDGKSDPILLKQYGKFGATSLGFNSHPPYGQCIDCFCLLDLLNSDTRSIERYMGKEQVSAYFRAHGRDPGVRPKRPA
jgi:hypothetical protein